MARYISEEPGFATYVQYVDRKPSLERDEELALARRFREHGDHEALDRLVEAHLRSVVKIAQKYRGYGIYLSDLVSEGNVGLIEAARRFEPERGLRFLTYARYWVRAYMLAYILKHWSIVDMGTNALQSKMFFRLQAEHSRLVGELGEDSGENIAERLASKFDTSVETVRSSLSRLGRRDASLDTPIVPESNLTFLDTLADQRENQEERTASAQLATLVHDAVNDVRASLDQREQMIVDARLLPADGNVETLAALGKRLGVTRERVRQLEVGVKEKLRLAFLRRFRGANDSYDDFSSIAA